MDELLMAPPITGAILRGLLPRRTLEPLIEEDFSDSSSSPSSDPISPQSGSSDQVNISLFFSREVCSSVNFELSAAPTQHTGAVAHWLRVCYRHTINVLSLLYSTGETLC